MISLGIFTLDTFNGIRDGARYASFLVLLVGSAAAAQPAPSGQATSRPEMPRVASRPEAESRSLGPAGTQQELIDEALEGEEKKRYQAELRQAMNTNTGFGFLTSIDRALKSLNQARDEKAANIREKGRESKKESLLETQQKVRAAGNDSADCSTAIVRLRGWGQALEKATQAFAEGAVHAKYRQRKKCLAAYRRGLAAMQKSAVPPVDITATEREARLPWAKAEFGRLLERSLVQHKQSLNRVGECDPCLCGMILADSDGAYRRLDTALRLWADGLQVQYTDKANFCLAEAVAEAWVRMETKCPARDDLVVTACWWLDAAKGLGKRQDGRDALYRTGEEKLRMRQQKPLSNGSQAR